MRKQKLRFCEEKQINFGCESVSSVMNNQKMINFEYSS